MFAEGLQSKLCVRLSEMTMNIVTVEGQFVSILFGLLID